jgi:hypothetical protein
MQACTYCGRENQDGAISCKECGTSLVVIAEADSFIERFSAWSFVIGLGLAALAGLWLLLMASARIDFAEEFDTALQLSGLHSLPMALASFFLVFGITQRLRPVMRFLSRGAAVILVWIICSQLLQSAYYSQLRSRGADPERVLRSVRPNKSLQPTPGSGYRSAARFTSFGPAWLSSDR